MKVNLSPSEKAIVDLASMQYENLELEEIANWNGTIYELDAQYPIECLRKGDKIYRASYLGKDKIVVVVFDDFGNKILGKVYDARVSNVSFSELTVGKNLSDVEKIDPEGEYLFLYTGRNDTPRISHHFTREGCLITVEYDEANIVVRISEEFI